MLCISCGASEWEDAEDLGYGVKVCVVCDAQQVETLDAEGLTAEEFGLNIASNIRVKVSQHHTQHLETPQDLAEAGSAAAPATLTDPRAPTRAEKPPDAAPPLQTMRQVFPLEERTYLHDKNEFLQRRALYRTVLCELTRSISRQVAALLKTPASVALDHTAKQIFLHWAKYDIQQDEEWNVHFQRTKAFKDKADARENAELPESPRKDRRDPELSNTCAYHTHAPLLPATITLLACHLLREPLLPCQLVRWFGNNTLKQNASTVIRDQIRWRGSRILALAVISKFSLHCLPSAHQLRVAVCCFLHNQPSSALLPALCKARNALVRKNLLTHHALAEGNWSKKNQTRGDKKRNPQQPSQEFVEIFFAKASFIANADLSIHFLINQLVNNVTSSAQDQVASEADHRQNLEELWNRWLESALRFRRARLQARRLVLYGSSVECGEEFRKALTRAKIADDGDDDEEKGEEHQKTTRRYVFSALLAHEGVERVHPVEKRMKKNTIEPRDLEDVLSCTEYDVAADVIASLMLCGSREGVEVVVRSASRRRQLGLLESALETAILDKKSERELSLEQLDAFTNTMVDVLHEQRTPTRPFARTTEQFANTVSQQLLQQQRNARERLALNTRASASITGSTGMDEKSLEQLKEQLCAVMVDRIIHARPGSHCGAFQTRRAVKYLYDLTTLWTRVVEEYVSFFSD